jgi:cyclase
VLKRRIIPIELLSAGRLIKTRVFSDSRDVGDPVKSSKVYSDQDADELVLLNIDRENRTVSNLTSVLSRIAEHCFVPLTAGGGIVCTEDAASLFSVGVDKVVANSVAYRNPSVVTDISTRYGQQAVVVSVDVRNEDGDYALYSDCGRRREIPSLEEHIVNMIAAGAGEILVQSIDRDGTMVGYDLDLMRRALAASSVPVIAVAGAGNFSHLKDVLELGVAAAACGSLFNFGDNNPLRAKAYLKNYSIPLKRV